MLLKNFSRAEQDYIIFMDSGSSVPYHMEDVPYYPIPVIKLETLEYEDKLYIKSNSFYCVGTRLHSFVRKISAQDYRKIKSEIEAKKKSNSIVGKQLVMDFS